LIGKANYGYIGVALAIVEVLAYQRGQRTKEKGKRTEDKGKRIKEKGNVVSLSIRDTSL